MTTQPKRRSRYDLAEEPLAVPLAGAPPMNAGPWGAPAEAEEARRLLSAARLDVERVLASQMQELESALAARAAQVGAQLQQARAEIERLERETAALRSKRYDDVLKQLRDRVNAL